MKYVYSVTGNTFDYRFIIFDNAISQSECIQFIVIGNTFLLSEPFIHQVDHVRACIWCIYVYFSADLVV